MPDDPIDPPAPVPTPATPPDEGKGGKEALLADLAGERDRRQAAEKAAKDATSALEKLQKESMTDQEKAVAEARAEGRKEALATATERLLRAEIKAAAAGKLADPGDAAALLGDLSRFVNDGEADTKAITSAIDALVKAKPYLSARPGNGSGEGGPRGSTASKEPTMDDWIRQTAAKS